MFNYVFYCSASRAMHAKTLLCIVTIICNSAELATGVCLNRSDCVGCGSSTYDCCLGSVAEKQGPNQYSGYVWSSSTLTQYAAPSTYAITTQSAADTFMVASNGSVWTSKSLDVLQMACWVFTVRITTVVMGSQQQVQSLIVGVGVIDINDNPPTLSGLPATVNVSVTRIAGGVSLCYLLVDRDAGMNGNVSTVRIVAGDSTNLFAVMILQPPQACIVNTGILDGLSASRFNLTVLAVDQGTPPLNSTTWVVVQLTGVNYFAPYFLSLQPLGPLPDNTPVGTVIQRFLATDNDTGENGRVTYSIQSVVPPSSIFDINQTSGVLVLSAPFDLATTRIPMYAVCVTATDSSPVFPLSSSICTNVTVTPSSPPPVTFATPPSCFIGVQENAQNALVGRFIFDTSRSVNIQCTVLVGSTNFTVHNTYPNSGPLLYCDVSVIGFLDFEKASQLNVTIGVTWDASLLLGTSPNLNLYNIYTCTVNVRDVNDNAPFLSRTNFTFVEKQPLGSFVLQLSGSDRDSGTNGVIATYSLVRVTNATTDLTHLNLFDMNAQTGLLTNRVVIERRVVGKILNLTVNLTDAGTPPQTSSIAVQLEVIGVLSFTSDAYTFVVFTGVPAPVTLGRVEAVVGGASTRTVFYNLAGSSNTFAVDAQGNVSALVTFGSPGPHEFSVLARDSGTPPGSSTAMVKVSVVDICKGAQNLTVRSSAVAGASLGYVIAGGPTDVAWNYRVTGSGEVFDVNTSSGEVTVKRVPVRWSSFYVVTFTSFVPDFANLSTECSLVVSLLADPPSFPAAVVIAGSVGPALFLLVTILLVIVVFYCYRRRHGKRLPISGRRDSLQLSDLPGASCQSPPKGILNPVAFEGEAKGSEGGAKGSGGGTRGARGTKGAKEGVKFNYTAEEYLVNQEESVAAADTTMKKYSNVKFGASNSPLNAPRTPTRAEFSPPDLSSPLSGVESSHRPLPPHSQPPSSLMSPHGNPSFPSYAPATAPSTSSRLVPRPPLAYPLAHGDMLDHSLATNAGRSRLYEANSIEDSTCSDNTSSRNTCIPCFKHGSNEPLSRYMGPHIPGSSSSPPSFLPPPNPRDGPPLPSNSAYGRRDYLRSPPTSPQHGDDSLTDAGGSRSTTPPRRMHAPLLPAMPGSHQMVPQPGPPSTYYPEVMPSALDPSDLGSEMTQSRFSLTEESQASSILDDELRFHQEMDKNFYDLTYNDDGSES